MEFFEQLHEELKGTKTVHSKLTIKGFDDEQYEELYYQLIELLSPYIRAGYEDYWDWYSWVCKSYINFRKKNSRKLDYTCNQMQEVETHSIREQLAVLRWYIYRRTTSYYPVKGEY